jgi:hypothetical protein
MGAGMRMKTVKVYTLEEALELRKKYKAIDTLWKFIQHENEKLRETERYKKAVALAPQYGIDVSLYDNCHENWSTILKYIGKISLGLKEEGVDANIIEKLRPLNDLACWPFGFRSVIDDILSMQYWNFTDPPKDNDLLPIELHGEKDRYAYPAEEDWLGTKIFGNPRGPIRAVVYTEKRYHEYNFQDIPATKKLLEVIKETAAQWREAAKATGFDFDQEAPDFRKLEEKAAEQRWEKFRYFLEVREQTAWDAAPEELRNEHIKAVRQLVKRVWKYHQQELLKNDRSKYRTIQQGKATNQLARTDFRVKPEQLSLFGNAVIEKNGFKVFIDQFNQLKNGVRPTAQQLLDALLIEATESSKSPEESEDTLVTLPLKKYMQIRGLSDEKHARSQVKEDLDSLAKLRIYFAEKNNNYDFPICGGKGIVRGVITIRFDKDFFKLYRSYPVMAYHEELLKINLRANPYSLRLGRRILEHKNMNIGKSNENIMRVATLLDAIPEMPSYEELGEAGQVRKRIIDPFERDMNYFEKANMFTWHYCGKNGAEMSEPTTRREFEESLIKFTWLDYPDQTTRLKKIAERAVGKEENKKAKPQRAKSTS